MDNFYLTIPSTATIGNTQSSFVTHLAAPIELTGQWEVGLAEAHILHDFNNIDSSNNSFTIQFGPKAVEPTPQFSFLYEVPVSPKLPLFESDVNPRLQAQGIQLIHEDKTVTVKMRRSGHAIEFSPLLQETLQMPFTAKVTGSITIPAPGRIDPKAKWNPEDYLIRVIKQNTTPQNSALHYDLKIPEGWYETPDTLFKSIRSVIPNDYGRYIRLSENADGTVSLDTDDDMRIKFGNGLREMLGFTEDSFLTGHKDSKYPIELRRGVYGIYVYTDIILPQLVGNSYGNLLRVLPVDKERRQTLIVSNYETPDYYPLARNSFDSVEIYLRTENGDPIVFRSGKTLIKLHFRRKQ